MTQVCLQRPCVVAPVCKRVPARMCGCGLIASLALVAARSIMRAKPAVVNGVPRSDVNTKGDFGS